MHLLNDKIKLLFSMKLMIGAQVGDIICVEEGDEFPCDMLILSSSNPKGKASIMTANLDGETNLKTQSAPNETRDMTQPHLLNNLRAQVVM